MKITNADRSYSHYFVGGILEGKFVSGGEVTPEVAGWLLVHYPFSESPDLTSNYLVTWVI